ncbi:MAG: monofunctional biosynthetic peptidoglycan transglycosylase [Spirochaetaceae bacterium]|nr:MAG: monofunctional biosynthetic peptidoglycan transglycosylase [Spirochaetaceae bacterium]
MSNLFKLLKVLAAIIPYSIILFHLCFLGVIGTSIFQLHDHNPASTPLMRSRPFTPVSIPPGFTQLNKLPSDLVRTILFAEDGYFFRHGGFSLRYIQRALDLNQRMGYSAYGGSTVTQQLARTLFLNIDKSYLRKYFELLIAIEMEMLISKNRILELYMNYIELGPGIYGITDAARVYFNKSPRECTSEEKLMLATIMPAPIQYSPFTFRSNEILVRRYLYLRHYFQFEQRIPPRFSSEIEELPLSALD